jgi:signal transduction histidine kinase
MAATLPVQRDVVRAPRDAPGPESARPKIARSPDADLARTRNAAVALGTFVLLYLSWQLLDWIPGDRQSVGDLLVLPVDAAAVYAAWWASRRCTGSGRLRSFWRLMALALAAEALGDVVQAVYDIGLRQSPYPSLADPFYLAFYPLLLLALLTVTTRTKLLKPTLDGATIVVGGGAVVWYLVLGPTVEQSQSPLTMGVSMAFPLGDLFLLAGLAAMLLRPGPTAFRAPLKLITAAVLLGIAADVLYGYGQLHGTYTAGDWIDTLYVLEFATFALAGFSQRSVRRGDADAEVDDTAQSRSRASWLPYLSLAIGLGVLLGVEWGTRFFPTVSLVLIVIVLAVLVAARQYVAQRELVQAQAALRESERLKDEFLSIVGHELRTPLTSIRGSLGLLEGGVLGKLPEDAASMVSVAVLNTDRLVRLIGDILDIERMAAGGLLLEPVAVDAAELVSQSMQVLQASADAAGVTLRSEVPHISVLADADRIVQVLVNLLGNALKFSTRCSTVTVTVERKHRCAIFSVRDTGRGVPADRLDGIFDRFRQVDASDAREKGGTGLGLPIARGIVDRHGGRIWAESREGEGSTFRFTLPVAAEDLEPSRPDAVAPRVDAQIAPPGKVQRRREESRERHADGIRGRPHKSGVA